MGHYYDCPDCGEEMGCGGCACSRAERAKEKKLKTRKKPTTVRIKPKTKVEPKTDGGGWAIYGKANEVQVGGDHYRTELQHWDLISRFSVGYLEGCATKYITRWRKKNGRADLEKALHYIDKLVEVSKDPKLEYCHKFVPTEQVMKFVVANNLDLQETEAVRLILQCRGEENLPKARDIVARMLEEFVVAVPLSVSEASRRVGSHPRGFDPEQDA